MLWLNIYLFLRDYDLIIMYCNYAVIIPLVLQTEEVGFQVFLVGWRGIQI